MTDMHEAQQGDDQYRQPITLSLPEAAIYLGLDLVRTRDLLDDHEIGRRFIPLDRLDQAMAEELADPRGTYYSLHAH